VHRTTGVRYAAKVVDRRQLKSRDDDLVYQEVNILSDIRGSGVGLSKLVDFFDEETHFYIVVDFADGGDFMTALVKKQRLTEDEAKHMAKSLLKGLHYLHKNNICHRNLKPENILLRNERDMGSVVIADFGMATRILTDADGDMLRLTDRCGTAAYMAPEVIVQVPYDTQADMWTLGVIMYNVLAGRLPFEDPSRRAVYQKIVKCDYIFHPKDWLGISKAAKRFISNLIHADPDVRMTAEEALEHPWLADLMPIPKSVSPRAARLPPTQEEKSTTSRKRSGKKFKGSFWKAMTGKKANGLGEGEMMDDTKSTSSQTASNVSSDVTNDYREHRRWLEK
jgi:calcium/calmodulin-dependent protein kinase I